MPWVVAASLVTLLAVTKGDLDHRQKGLVIALYLLMVVYRGYAALAGQFWSYHQMPFRFFAVACMSLVLLPFLDVQASRFTTLLPVIVFVLALIAAFPPSVLTRHLFGPPFPTSLHDRSVEIARFLEDAELGSDDRVQPLDWVKGGAVHAMLIAKVKIASRFLHNYHFYHHVSDPFIQELRRRLIEDLEQTRPRFVIHWHRVHVSGEDTTDKFLRLDDFLRANYRVALQRDNYRILERTAD